MGLGFIICLVTHILAAFLPMYVVFPFAENLFGSGHGTCGDHHHDHSHGLLNHIVKDILIITMIILPVALLTWLGHKLLSRFKLKCGDAHEHEEDPCENCPHRKDLKTQPE